MKILYLSSEFAPRGGWGGIAASIREAAIGQIARGHEVHVLACGDGWPPENVTDEGIHVHRRPLLRRGLLGRLGSRLLGFRDGRRAWLGLSCYLHARRLGLRFDAVETPEWQGEGWLFTLLRFAPLVTTLHTPDWLVFEEATGVRTDATEDPRPCAERLCAERADAVVSPSELLAERLTTRGWLTRSDIAIQPYAMRTPATTTAAPAERNVLFCGHIDRRKAADVVLRAMSLVRRDFPEATALLLGRDTTFDGVLYTDRMRKLGLSFEGITIARVERPEVRAAIAAARVFVLPARFDNYPLAVLEAMAGGRPVVVSDRVGMAAMIRTREAGAVVPVDDAPALAAALGAYLADPALASRHGANARRAVTELLDPGAYADRRERVYEAAAVRFRARPRAALALWVLARLRRRLT